MSEYQYFEFRALDRRLTEMEMDKLRGYSSRAEITPTGFVNEYSWGDFNGDEDKWMDQYFDAFVHFANWGTRVFMLRFPATLLSFETVKQYCTSEWISVRKKGDKVILTFRSEEEGGDGWMEGEGLLDSLIAVRDEIARGDLRPLYLAWLSAHWEYEEDDTMEPPVPANLGKLSAAQKELAEFLRVDFDMVAAAAQASPDAPEISEPSDNELESWVASLDSNEKDRMLVQVIQDRCGTVAVELLSRFNRRQAGQTRPFGAPKRTAGELMAIATAITQERERVAAQKAAETKAKRQREAAIARQQYLDSIVSREPDLWASVDALIATRLPKNYDLVVQHLLDLRDLADRNGEQVRFINRLSDLRQSHSGKSSLMRRFREKGL